jgi:hypothetical protein
MQRINYQLFRQRKNFNPTVLFKNNLKLSYEEFCKFFIERNVEPPSETYYMNVKRHCESLTEVQPETQEVISPAIEEVPAVESNEIVVGGITLEVEEVKETVELVKEALETLEEKPKRKRRRKKKADSND